MAHAESQDEPAGEGVLQRRRGGDHRFGVAAVDDGDTKGDREAGARRQVEGGSYERVGPAVLLEPDRPGGFDVTDEGDGVIGGQVVEEPGQSPIPPGTSDEWLSEATIQGSLDMGLFSVGLGFRGHRPELSLIPNSLYRAQGIAISSGSGGVEAPR